MHILSVPLNKLIPHLPHQESESESEESVGGEELERKLREKALLSMKRQERSSAASDSD